ncbi:MAG: SDR family NAD(P)-dependent oxidoreductase [Bacteroidales bacterium]|nr:SDR family NAD(P)-dependent oxidoreductase [Bacteroidales bacterium]
MSVVILTGASSGIGFATAKMLGKQGHRRYVACRRVEMMEPLKDYGCVPLYVDMTDSDSIQQLVQFVMEREGRIDVLVNNAGYGHFGAIENVTMEQARRQMEVNLFGLAELTKAVLPIMRAQGGGRIVNTSSVAGRCVLGFGGWYHVSKYALEAFSDALRIETKPFGIKVIMIEPGGIKTNWGPIAADFLAENGKGTPYEQASLNEAYWFKLGYGSNLLSSPKVVARAISKAVNRRCPCSRYIVGMGAYSLLIMRALLPTCLWDAFARVFGKMKRRA